MRDEENLSAEVEAVTAPTIFEETVILASLALAILSIFLFAWIADSMAHNRTQNFDWSVRTEVAETDWCWQRWRHWRFSCGRADGGRQCGCSSRWRVRWCLICR